MRTSKKHLSRRDFMKNSAIGLAAFSATGMLNSCSKSPKPTMPMRTLGKTGLQVSVLSFGGGSQFQKNKDGAWEALLERAVEAGINFFDTASDYQFRGSICSEERFGQILSRHRNKIYISTKFNSRNPAEMLQEFETSLKRMKTDYVDVLMIHSIEPSEDIAVLENGVYKEMRRLKEEGSAKYIGFSSMNSAEKSAEVLEKLEMDIVILAMNPTQYGKFTEIALPVARQKNVGVLAMKVMRDIIGKENTTAKELLRYALTQEGVATALVGHFGRETLEENIRLVKEISDETAVGLPFDRQVLENRLARYANPETLEWARPDYRDGMWA